MVKRWIGSCIGILAVVAACFVWSPPAGAAASSATVAPMSGGPNCGKRAKVYDKIWSVKAHDNRVVFLRCGEFQPPTGGWGWSHIIGRQHPGQLGWDQDFFMWAMQQTVKGADPKDQSGERAETNEFELRVEVNNPNDLYTAGQRAYVRLLVDKRPLVWQWYDRFLQLIETRNVQSKWL